MKKILLSLIAAFTLFGSLQAQVETQVAGKYNGDLYISLGTPIDETTEAITGQNIDIKTGAAAGTVDFALYNFGFGEMLLGDILLPAIGVSEDGDKVKFAENPVINLSFLDGGIEATATLNPTKSYIQGDEIVAVIDVVWTNTGEAPIPIYVMFKGTKLQPVALADTYNGKLFVSAEAPVTDATPAVDGQSMKLAAIEGDPYSFDVTVSNFAVNGTVWGDVTFPATIIAKGTSGFVFNNTTVYEGAFNGGAIPSMWMMSAPECAFNEATAEMTFSFIIADATNADAPATYYAIFKGTKSTPVGITDATIQPAAKQGVYTLSGVKLAPGAKLAKGIYVINGKKTIIK